MRTKTVLRAVLAGGLAVGAFAFGSAVRADSLTSFRVIYEDPVVIVFEIVAPESLNGTPCQIRNDLGLPVGGLTVHTGPQPFMIPQDNAAYHTANGPGYSLRESTDGDGGLN